MSTTGMGKSPVLPASNWSSKKKRRDDCSGGGPSVAWQTAPVIGSPKSWGQ
jgi:hypothetical protein